MRIDWHIPLRFFLDANQESSLATLLVSLLGFYPSKKPPTDQNATQS